MRKLSILAAGLVAMLGVTSCSNDDQFDISGNGSDANVSFTLELPKGLASRAFGDGTTATTLSYAVYDVTDDATFNDENQIYKDNDVTFAGLKATKNFKLVNGRTYTFVFWADKGEGSPYTFNGTGVSVDYTDLTNNEEGRDAFFAVKSDIKVTGSFTQNVELYRPFAQLNLGTDDLAEEVVTKVYGENCANLNTKLTVKVPNALNLIDGTVAEQSTWAEVTFGPNGIPSDETFPVEHPESGKAYGYLSMNYLLMPEDKSLVDVTYEFYNGTSTEAAKTINLTNVPVQRNFRTNIFGSLLTSEGNFNIEIVPGFDGSEDIKVWDGAKEEPVADADGNYTIKTAAQLAGFAEMVNNGNTFKGKTVTLTSDINLGGIIWKPAGNVASYPSVTFDGTFDGGGHTIIGLNAVDNTPAYAAAGLFGSLTGKVMNLNVENAKVTSTHYAGVICGYSSANVGMSIENCHVKNSTVISMVEKIGSGYDNGDKAGGIIGYTVTGDEIKNCSVENITVEGYRHIGGIAGYAMATIAGCSVKNAHLVQNLTNGYKSYDDIKTAIAPIAGNGTGVDNNTSENVTIEVIGTTQTIAQLIAAGGNVSVGTEMENIDLSSYSADKPLNLTLNAAVKTLTVGGFEQPVTITVAKDVAYPTLSVNNNILKNFTLKGDVTSSEKFESPTRLQTIENVIFENVAFLSATKLLYGSSININGLTVKNCVFENITSPAVQIQSPGKAENITIEGCTITYATSSLTGNVNGLYLLDLTGDITVRNNNISGANQHGVFIRTSGKAEVVGNKIVTPRDGVKIEGQLGCTETIVTGNTIQAGENGVRVKDPVDAASVTITGNTIDMTKAISFNETENEPWGIYVYKNNTVDMGCKIIAKDNKKIGMNEHWAQFKNATNVANDIASPYVN